MAERLQYCHDRNSLLASVIMIPARPNPLFHAVMLWLAFAGLFLRLLIPNGYMPSFAADGAMSMVICSDQGAITIIVDDHGQPIKNQKKSPEKSHHTPCAFAMMGTIALADPIISFALPSVTLLTTQRILLEQLRLNNTRTIVHGPRGPPALSLN